MKVDRLEIPIWQKYTMTIEEAAAYFHIGRTRMRALVAENPYAPRKLNNHAISSKDVSIK